MITSLSILEMQKNIESTRFLLLSIDNVALELVVFIFYFRTFGSLLDFKTHICANFPHDLKARLIASPSTYRCLIVSTDDAREHVMNHFNNNKK